jgi:hypothetical protein
MNVSASERAPSAYSCFSQGGDFVIKVVRVSISSVFSAMTDVFPLLSFQTNSSMNSFGR